MATTMQAGDQRPPGLAERVLAERGRDGGRLQRLEGDRQGTALQHDREVLRLVDRADAGDLSAVRAADPVRVLLPVDRRPRLDLAVEDDREVLRHRLAEQVRLGAPTAGDIAGDAAEDVGALVRERHRHDRLAGLGVEVLARARQAQLLTGHLGDDVLLVGVAGVVADQVVRVRRRVLDVDAGAHDLAAAALEHDRLRRHAEEPPALRQLVARGALAARLLERLAVEQLLLRGRRPGDDLLLVVEQVPARGVVVLDQRLLAREQLMDGRGRDGEAVDVDRRRHEVLLEVEELELRGLAEDLDHALGVLDARDADRDLVVARLADLGLGDAEGVDAVAEDLDGALEVGRLQRPVRRRHRLQRHLEARPGGPGRASASASAASRGSPGERRR